MNAGPFQFRHRLPGLVGTVLLEEALQLAGREGAAVETGREDVVINLLVCGSLKKR